MNWNKKTQLSKGEESFSRLAKAHIYTILRSFFTSRHTVIFAHLPKAAGISLNAVMKKQYGDDRVLEVPPLRPRRSFLNVVDMPVWNTIRLRAISGHVIWGIHEWLPRPYIYLTVLRDPIERILSFYSYVRASSGHHLHKKVVERNMSLEDFLVWDKSFFELSNLQCKLLSSMYPFREADLSVVFAKARINIEKYFLVGLTERFQESLAMFSRALGWSGSQIERENVTPDRVKRKDVSPDVIKKIEALNEFDMELYEIGSRLFAEQSRDPQSAFRQKIKR